MSALLDAWNRTLRDHGVSLKFTDSFRHTGNYVLNDDQDAGGSGVQELLTAHRK
jgi:hypothetical protein